MIKNHAQLQVAIERLSQFEQVLEQIRLELLDKNPSLFVIISKGYLHRIANLKNEIISYIMQNPADTPFRILLKGGEVEYGKIPLKVFALVADNIQTAIYETGRELRDAGFNIGRALEQYGFRRLLCMNLQATPAGSFIMAMGKNSIQEELFADINFIDKTLETVIMHVDELHKANKEFTGSRSTLRALDQINSLIEKKRLDSMTIEYNSRFGISSAILDLTAIDKFNRLMNRPTSGEQTVEGVLYEINTELKTLKLRVDKFGIIDGTYIDVIEDELIACVKKTIQVSGLLTTYVSRRPPLLKRIERFKIVDDDV